MAASHLCDKTSGACECKANVVGRACNQCGPNTFNLTPDNPLGCQPCDCDITGTIGGGTGACDQNTGACTCLANRVGRRCESCVASE